MKSTVGVPIEADSGGLESLLIVGRGVLKTCAERAVPTSRMLLSSLRRQVAFLHGNGMGRFGRGAAAFI